MLLPGNTHYIFSFVSAAPNAAGAPYTQFDNALPGSNPGYTAGWPLSALCNNSFDPIARVFKLRYGYLNQASGWRIFEEIIKLY